MKKMVIGSIVVVMLLICLAMKPQAQSTGGEKVKVYAVIEVKVKDPSKFGEYVKGHLPTITQYGGKFLFEGQKMKNVEGSSDWMLAIVQEWPSEEAFNKWWDSPEYKPWKEMRPQGADVNLTLTKSLH